MYNVSIMVFASHKELIVFADCAFEYMYFNILNINLITITIAVQ